MDYQETLNYLYTSAPLFQQIGSEAYKEGLQNTLLLDEHFHHPHQTFHSIHIAGTNGKGSCSHSIAAVLQAAGYKVGLYTSPHLVDFRERIRINGTPISQKEVIDFVERERTFFEPLHPSFFELTTAMAFRHFALHQVDVAVIEVGLGGRLDCTNIIRPDLCIITNISLDHVQFLGHTPAEIAREKAGIIKPGVPVIIGESTDETLKVFQAKAMETQTPLYRAESYDCSTMGEIEFELKGIYQKKNKQTILTALSVLKEIGYQFNLEHIHQGLENVCELTGLMGRWQTLLSSPRLVCDTGHNVGGISYIAQQLKEQKYATLRIVMGMVNDKDIRGVLSLLPTHATYYFTKASVKRAMPEEEFATIAGEFGLKGHCYTCVSDAVEAALKESLPEDFIFVGGSSFIVADLLSNRHALNLD